MFRSLVRRARRLLAGAAFAGAAACSAPAASAEGRSPSRVPVPDGAGVAGHQASPVPAASSRPSVSKSDAFAERDAGLLFRFDTGSPVFGAPAVGPDGTLYVGTADGRVLAISPDGVLLWSYTVEGAVAWSPRYDLREERDDARLFVATAAGRLYSFSPSGALGWVVHTPVHVETPLVVSTAWGVLFGGTDSSVWAYARHGTAAWHVEIGAPISAGPEVAGSDAHGAGKERIVLGTTSGEAWLLDGAKKRYVARLGAAVSSIPAVFADGSAAVLAENTLYRLDDRAGIRFRREEIAYASFSPSGAAVAIDVHGALVRLDTDGTEQRRLALDLVSSSAPVIDSAGNVHISTDSGVLVIVAPDDTVRRVPIAHGVLQRVMLDEVRHRVLIAVGSGVVAAFAAPW